tara:strand:+ start:2115 stop:2972 length:858 start_codon:yes stop_codon:yes gene_type:complete
MGSVFEQQGNRTIGLANSGKDFTAQRMFHAVGYADELQVRSEFGGGTMPALGDEHPAAQGLFAAEFEIALVAGHADVWSVKFIYKTSTFQGSDQDPEEPETPTTPGYVEITANTSTEFIDIYRNNPTNLPADGEPLSVNMPSDADIGGTPVAAGGAPVSAPNFKVEIGVGVTERFTDIRFDNIRENVGKRVEETLYFGGQSSASELTLPAHKTLYLGANATRTGVNLAKVNHRFLVDENFHMRFVCYRNIHSDMELDDTTFAPRFVVPVQPFPNKFNARILSVHF